MSGTFETLLHVTVVAILLCDVMATSNYYSLTQDLRSREAIKGQVPPGAGVTPVTVDVMFVLIDIIDIDDAKQVVSVSSALTLMWSDQSLAWDSSAAGPYPNLHSIEVKTVELWTPMVYIMNGASEDRMVNTGPTAFIYSNGTVALPASPLLKFTCSMDLTVYPFDTQECKLIIMCVAAVSLIGREANDPGLGIESFVDNFAFNGEWMIEKLEGEKKSTSIPGAHLGYTMKLRRKTTFYVISFIVPIVLTSYMNTLVFVIPAESGERVSYLVSIFVSNAVFVSFCTDQMPQGLNSVPLVMYLLLGTMAQSLILIILVSCLLRTFYRHQRDVTDDVTRVSCFIKNSLREKAVLSKNAVHHLNDSASTSKKFASQKFRSGRVDCACFFAALFLNTAFVVWLLFSIIRVK